MSTRAGHHDVTGPRVTGRVARLRRRAGLLVGLAAAGLALSSCAVPFAGTGMPMMGMRSTCAPTHLTGSVVRVALMDMRHRMMMGGGAMRLVAAPGTVRAGRVTFVARNVGRHTHELVVLPLHGARAGLLPVGPHHRVSEAGSLGEASRSCGSGAGQGIRPGTSGWVTLRLGAGRYELVCNEPRHYQRGMHAELVVR
ncbi:MAG TPA: hypothetical protein VFP72_09810 [Kineosporiaceae bacterium]|nr:hypothetical protein [Kineosporiaceae bacterium]